MFKSTFFFVGKLILVLVVAVCLGLIREPKLRPDLRPLVRYMGKYISGIYPEDKPQPKAQLLFPNTPFPYSHFPSDLNSRMVPVPMAASSSRASDL